MLKLMKILPVGVGGRDGKCDWCGSWSHTLGGGGSCLETCIVIWSSIQMARGHGDFGSEAIHGRHFWPSLSSLYWLLVSGGMVVLELTLFD